MSIIAVYTSGGFSIGVYPRVRTVHRGVLSRIGNITFLENAVTLNLKACLDRFAREFMHINDVVVMWELAPSTSRRANCPESTERPQDALYTQRFPHLRSLFKHSPYLGTLAAAGTRRAILHGRAFTTPTLHQEPRRRTIAGSLTRAPMLGNISVASHRMCKTIGWPSH